MVEGYIRGILSGSNSFSSGTFDSQRCMYTVKTLRCRLFVDNVFHFTDHLLDVGNR